MKGRLFVISKIIIIILRFPYSISGNKYNDNYQCATYGEHCDPYQHNSCCGESVICKRRSSNFTCREKGDVQNVVLGSTCEDNADCLTIKFSECSESKICTCVLNTISMSGTECTPLLHVYCKDNSQCRVNNSACIYNKCQCISNYVNHRYGECQPVSLGNVCASNSDCQILQNSKCSESNKCVCNDDNIIINSVCVPILNGFCSNDEHCQSYGFHCVDNKCQCKPNFTLLSTSQCVETHLLFSCNNNLDCGEPWHTKCSEDKKCVCASNNIAMNRSTCYPTLRGRCWNNHQCVANNSICVDFQCKCQANFFAISNNLCVSDY